MSGKNEEKGKRENGKEKRLRVRKDNLEGRKEVSK